MNSKEYGLLGIILVSIAAFIIIPNAPIQGGLKFVLLIALGLFIITTYLFRRGSIKENKKKIGNE